MKLILDMFFGLRSDKHFLHDAEVRHVIRVEHEVKVRNILGVGNEAAG